MPANSCGIYSAVFETCKGHILSTVDYENIKASLNQKKNSLNNVARKMLI